MSMRFEPFEGEGGPSEAKRSRWSPPALLVGILVAAALIAFVAQNRATVSVDWLFLGFQAPLYLVIVVSALAGAVIMAVADRFLRRRNRRSPGRG